VIAVTVLGATMFAGTPAAPARVRCTIKGTSGDDRLIDTGGASVICARGGDDLVEAGPAADLVLGGKGADRLEGNDGKDVVKDGPGGDTIVVADGVGGNDRALGGSGTDTCYLDRGDRAKGCETKTIVA
jgi:Ca2+-binding RTX toxin-like protein